MCWCTPGIKTPFCGKGDCVWPDRKPRNARLDRNNHRHGMGKYALIKLRRIETEVVTPNEVAIVASQNPSIVDLGLKGSDSEFFVIRLKDRFAVPALQAYYDAVKDVDPEYAEEILELLGRAKTHPNKKNPD